MLLQFVVSFGSILVVNAPQNMVAYGTETFEARDFARSGLVLTAIALGLVLASEQPTGAGWDTPEDTAVWARGAGGQVYRLRPCSDAGLTLSMKASNALISRGSKVKRGMAGCPVTIPSANASARFWIG